MLVEYSHVFSGQESEAIEKLPDFTLTGKQQAKATGTDGKQTETAYKPAYKKLANNAYSGFDQSSLIGTTQTMQKMNAPEIPLACKSLESVQLGNKKTPMSLIDTDVSKAEEEGFEPPEGCPSTVFKTVTLSRSVTPPSLYFVRLYCKNTALENG